MNNKLDLFLSPFLALNKNECFQLLETWKVEDDFRVLEFYETVLIPAMKYIPCEDGEYVIWKEHIMTSIIQSMIDSLFMTVLRQAVKYEDRKKVAIFSPAEENHEVGTKIASDYFTLLGFESIYIGPNTPRFVMKEMIEELQIDVIAISITNAFHLAELLKLINELKDSNITIPIVAGGMAFQHAHKLRDLSEQILVLQTYDELKQWVDGGLKV